ncbi:MAG: type I-C CRISPR-associated protein Cas8c/Csd1 [Syntrophobacteraceae bacterium]
MILQELRRLYERLYMEGVPEIEPLGFKRVQIPFLINIDRSGKFQGLDDTREGEGRKKTTRTFLVPKIFEGSRTSNVKANLLWDKASYVFGVSHGGKRERLTEQKRKFRSTIDEYFTAADTDEGVTAVCEFIDHYSEDIQTHPQWEEISKNDPNLAFRLAGHSELICASAAVKSAIEVRSRLEQSEKGICLLSGDSGEMARLENPIRGLYGSGKAESHLMAFNESAYWSYGKGKEKTGANAPISKKYSWEYVAAINYLQRRGSRQALFVGDSTTVFWAEKRHDIENIFADLFGEPAKGEPEQDYKAIVAMFRAPETGAPPHLDPDTHFYVLGLSPNAARIAVRFWYAGTVREVADNIWRHFDDLEMVKGAKEWRSITLRNLLRATALLGKDDNVPPNLAGDTMEAILAGTPYPQTLLSAAVRRCRAEQSKRDPNTGKLLENVPYPRAALIKAVLVRDTRFGTRFCLKNEKEISMSLDMENTNPGYRLGRLFAVLEKIQGEANPGINATIRDRFYGSASATPVAAFPHLMKLKNHHLAKLENQGRVVNLEKMIGEIIDGINDFPAHLGLADQGRFAVGYYHQRQAFFVK